VQITARACANFSDYSRRLTRSQREKVKQVTGHTATDIFRMMASSDSEKRRLPISELGHRIVILMRVRRMERSIFDKFGLFARELSARRASQSLANPQRQPTCPAIGVQSRPVPS